MTDRELLKAFIKTLKFEIGQRFGGTLTGVKIFPMQKKRTAVTINREYRAKKVDFKNSMSVTVTRKLWGEWENMWDGTAIRDKGFENQPIFVVRLKEPKIDEALPLATINKGSAIDRVIEWLKL